MRKLRGIGDNHQRAEYLGTMRKIAERKWEMTEENAVQSVTLSLAANSPAELAAMLRRLADALDGSSLSNGQNGGAESSPTVLWYRQNAGRFLDRLAVDARRAVIKVAEHAPEMRISDLAAALKIDQGPQLARHPRFGRLGRQDDGGTYAPVSPREEALRDRPSRRGSHSPSGRR